MKSFDDWAQDMADHIAKKQAVEKVCECCEGTGEMMVMECYGGPPVEREYPCILCCRDEFLAAGGTWFDL